MFHFLPQQWDANSKMANIQKDLNVKVVQDNKMFRRLDNQSIANPYGAYI